MKARYETIAKLWLITSILVAVGWVILSPASIRRCSFPAHFDIIESRKSGLIVVSDATDKELQALTGKSSLDDLDSVMSVNISKRPMKEFSFLSRWIQSTGDSQMRWTTYWGFENQPTRAEIKQIILDAANAEPLTEVAAHEFESLRRSGTLAAMQSPPGIRYEVLPFNIIADLLVTLFIIGAFVSFIYLARWYAVRSRLDSSNCPNCNYPGAGLPADAPCPECGSQYA